MTPRPLTRTEPAPPVRLVHLGNGAFFRAHQAWCTDRAPDAAEWGYAAFGGRGGALARLLAAQDGLYTVVVRSPEGDEHRVVRSLSAVHAADDHEAWLARFRSPLLAAVTTTVTEAGYRADDAGNLDGDDPEVRADIEALRRSPVAAVRTAPARLVAGLVARHRAEAGPVALIPCDNRPANGAVARQVVVELADRVGPAARAAVEATASVVSTVVDRITPATTERDIAAVRTATGRADAGPVVTEPFWEWVLAGELPAGGPDWAAAGAAFVADVAPFEQRKLTLLNGAHTLLAYAGSILGHRTVGEAIDDSLCRAWVEDWWDEAATHLAQPTHELARYREALVDRFGNRRLGHGLSQIAADGSLKVPARVLPTVRAERAAGRVPLAAAVILGAWLSHLRGAGAPLSDVGADRFAAAARGPLGEAARAVLAELDPALPDDDLVAATATAAARFERVGR